MSLHFPIPTDNDKMSAAGAMGGPLANSIPSTMASLPQNGYEAESGVQSPSESDATPKGDTTPDSSSEKEKENGLYLNDGEEEEQEGARQMSAITQTWDKKSLVAVYGL